MLNRRGFMVLAGALSCAGAVRADDAAKLRVAVIGHTGRGDYGHSMDTLWLNLPETEVVAVSDPVEPGRAKVLAKLKISKGYADYKAMLAEMKPDLVSIGPRHVDQHLDMTLACCEAGVKGIYMEKPFCRTPAEADAIVAACEAKNVKLALAHRNRYHPALPMVAKLVKDGEIGTLLELRGRGKEDHRGGALDLWVLGSHVMNLAQYIAGDPLACSATLFKDGKPVTKADVADGAEGVGPLAGNEVHARYEMSNGVPFYFDSIQKAGVTAANFGLQLIGNKGIIDLRVDTHPIAQLLPGNPTHPTAEPRVWKPISSAGVGVPEPVEKAGNDTGSHRYAVRDLIAAIKENCAPLCDARAGRTTVEMICAVFESHRKNGARVTWPLEFRGNALGAL